MTNKTDPQTVLLLKGLEELQAKLAAQQQAEAARRAKLTPEQRAAEDHAGAIARDTAKRKKITQRLSKFGVAVLERESWTVDQFAWLLVGENPDERGDFFDLEWDTAAADRKKIVAVLQSCTRTEHLQPLNPEAPEATHRYLVSDLMAVAQRKKLGWFTELAAIIQPARPSTSEPTPKHSQPEKASKAPPSSVGTASREQAAAKRMKELAAFARGLAETGRGNVTATEISLAMSGIEFNDLFRMAHPQWKGLSDRQLARDRGDTKPSISVRVGRPGNKKNGDMPPETASS